MIEMKEHWWAWITGNKGPPGAQIKAKNNNSKVFGSLYVRLGWS